MSQTRRAIEQLIEQHKLPLKHAEAAAIHLEVYPSKRTWLSFFDKALLIIGALALVLSLVFFIAYNWQNLGKLGKFALVEGALVITIALYVALSFRRRFYFIRQLLLLVASIITGSLLALFGQVYQTGADTWQLFFAWAVLITPWVIIARFSTLWLLWLGLLNIAFILYIGVADFVFSTALSQYIFEIEKLALLNFIALNLWLFFTDDQANLNLKLSAAVTHKYTQRAQSSLHWSTYVVGLLSTFCVTYLAIIMVFEDTVFMAAAMTLLLWALWCGFMYWRFYKRHTDILMLTYLCGSIITVVMCWAVELKPSSMDIGGFFILTTLLISMSSYAAVWLRNISRLNNPNSDDEPTITEQTRGDYEK